MISRRELYAAGEPFGDSATRTEAGRRICGGGGGGGGTSTTQMTIPDELKPAAQSLSKIATNVGNSSYTPYYGQGVADLNGYQTSGMNMVANRALNGSQTMKNAELNLNQMMSGGSNPYLDQMVQRAQDSVKSNATTAAINSGSFGNSGIQSVLDKNLSDTATQMYGNAYNTDQANRLSAISQAPTFGNQAYTDASQLLNAGSTAYNNAQDKLDFGYQQYQNQQDYPLKQLGALSGVISGNSGSTTTQTGGGK